MKSRKSSKALASISVANFGAASSWRGRRAQVWDRGDGDGASAWAAPPDQAVQVVLGSGLLVLEVGHGVSRHVRHCLHVRRATFVWNALAVLAVAHRD